MNLNTKLENYMNFTLSTTTLFLFTWLFLTASAAYSHTGSLVTNANSFNTDSAKTGSFFSRKTQPDPDTYTNKIFDKNVRTMLLYTSKSELNPPIIQLNGSEQIILKFD